jgi:hypothetical protein
VFDAFFGRAICRAAPLRAAHLKSAIISGGASAIKTRGEVLEFSALLSLLVSFFVMVAGLTGTAYHPDRQINEVDQQSI